MNYKPNPSDLTFSKGKIQKYSLYLLASLVIVLSLSSCVGGIGGAKARLDEEFSLPVGQSVVLTGVDLGIKFVEVSGDSRCPKGATCVCYG